MVDDLLYRKIKLAILLVVIGIVFVLACIFVEDGFSNKNNEDELTEHELVTYLQEIYRNDDNNNSSTSNNDLVPKVLLEEKSGDITSGDSSGDELLTDINTEGSLSGNVEIDKNRSGE